MAKMVKTNTKNTPQELLKAIENADVWFMVTVKKDKNGEGAEVSVRESYSTGAINMIAMLLEHKEIYNAVQAKIAQVKMINKKQGNSSDITIN